jgi:serine/threonine-protein kinase 11
MAEVLVRTRLIEDHRFPPSDPGRKPKQINQYAIVRTIGYGSRTRVHLAIDTNTNLPYAAKAILASSCSCEREVRLLRSLVHPNVVRLHDVLHVKRQGRVYLILEWASCGSLAQAAAGGLSEGAAAAIFRQICDGLAYLHSQGIAHRDIKPSNILLFSDGVAKIGDFGMGHSFESADTVLGTPAYQPPEVFDESDDIVLDPEKEDVWSLGVSIFEAVFGRLPFVGANVFEIARSVLSGSLEVPESASACLRALLGGMLQPSPAARLSLAEVRAHEFFRNAGDRWEVSVTPALVPKLHPSQSVVPVPAAQVDDDSSPANGQRSASWPLGLYERR